MRFIRFIIVVSVLALLFAFEGRASGYTLHPAFDRSPVKIMDTPDCTYFLVHQQIYDKSKPTYDFPSLTLFKLIKGSESILPLTRSVKLSNSDIRVAEYLPDSDLLLIGYMDGGVDIVKNDGSVIMLNSLKSQSFPGWSVIRGITESPVSKSIFISTDAGYVEISSQDFKIISKLGIGPVDAVFRCGGNIIISCQSSLWESKMENPSGLNDFDRIGDCEDVAKVLPLDKNAFAYVKGKPGSVCELIKVYELADGKWEKIGVCKEQFSALPANQTVIESFEGNFLPTLGGYLITTSDKVMRLSNGNAIEIESLPIDQDMSPIGSWDFENFYTYRGRGKFVKRHYDNGWKDSGDPIRPDAPASFISTHISYSPEVGTVAINHGASQRLFNTTSINPALLSSWDGVQWSTPNYVYNVPDVVANTQAYKATYEKWIDRYPVPDPTGMEVDPLNPNYALISSIFGGIAIVDLSNRNHLPIKFCSPADPFASFPGSVPTLPNQNWDSFASFSSPVFDADGTAWTTYSNFKGSEATGEGKIQIKYLTAERRKALIEAAPENLLKMENWETISFPFYKTTQCFSMGIAFKNSRSRNFVITSLQNWGHGLAIWDHKGTLCDTSDDEMRLATGYITPDGSKREFIYAIDMKEDEATGELIVADFASVVKLAPPFSVDEEGYMRGEELKLLGEDSGNLLPESCIVNKLTFDSFHRLWIGTNNEGLICVSADGKRIEHRYTKENGGLPSNQVYGIGWNPEAGSLMVSTKLGLAELYPDKPAYHSCESDIIDINIYPKRIHPDYTGPLHLRNIPQNVEIRVRDCEGKVVRRIENDPHRYFGYDLEDSNGERLSTGIYTIEVGDLEPVEFIILK